MRKYTIDAYTAHAPEPTEPPDDELTDDEWQDYQEAEAEHRMMMEDER